MPLTHLKVVDAVISFKDTTNNMIWTLLDIKWMILSESGSI